MFTWNHFIWLGLTAALVLGLFYFMQHKKADFSFVLSFLWIICIISELTKMLSNMVPTGYKGGSVLDPGDLPFHLCSIQIFLVFTLKFFVKKPETREKMLGFMVPTMLLGGFAAIMIPTVGVKFTKPHVYEYFLFHGTIIFFALYVLKERLVTWSWKVLGRNLCYAGLAAYVVSLVNSLLSSGFPEANFMYLVRPPMEGLPVLNLDHGWYVYILSLVSVAVVLLTVFHGVAILVQNRSRCKC